MTTHDVTTQATQAAPDEAPVAERELWALAGIAMIFRWFEELINILNGPLLMFGAGIALVDLLTDGALTATDKWLLFAWAISQALGIDLQLLACFARARMAMLKHRYWALIGWLVLGIPLAIATWQAGYVYAIQQSEHIDEAAALIEAGMDRRAWLAWRVALAVLLVCLAGWTRYVAPRLSKASVAEERAKLEAKLALAPLQAQINAQQALGVNQAWSAIRGKSVVGMPSMAASVMATPARETVHLDQIETPTVAEARVAKIEHDETPPDDTPPPAPSGGPSGKRQKTASGQKTRGTVRASHVASGEGQTEGAPPPIDFARSVIAKQTSRRVLGESREARKTRQRRIAYRLLDQHGGKVSNAEIRRKTKCGPKQAADFRAAWQRDRARAKVVS